MIEKMKRIAAANHRSANKEIEVALEQYITAYERENGTIVIEKEEP